jgi:hypothetical protein
MMLEMTTKSIELYLFPKEKVKYDKTLKAMERWSSQPFPNSGVDYVRRMY